MFLDCRCQTSAEVRFHAVFEDFLLCIQNYLLDVTAQRTIEIRNVLVRGLGVVAMAVMVNEARSDFLPAMILCYMSDADGVFERPWDGFTS